MISGGRRIAPEFISDGLIFACCRVSKQPEICMIFAESAGAADPDLPPAGASAAPESANLAAKIPDRRQRRHSGPRRRLGLGAANPHDREALVIAASSDKMPAGDIAAGRAVDRTGPAA